jgi:MOSC domain-containing protein YiiM
VNHPKVHGGPERAVCLFALELIQALQDEGHPVFPGAVGENLTVAGLDWPALEEGAVVRVGGAVRLQLTRRVEPCRTIAASFADGAFKRIKPDRAPDETRWYARVLAEGRVRPGDEVRVEAGGTL